MDEMLNCEPAIVTDVAAMEMKYHRSGTSQLVLDLPERRLDDMAF